MTTSDANALITAAARGLHDLTGSDLTLVLEHVARAGFDPHSRERVRGELTGMTWRGAVLRGADRLPPAERHYLKHVVRRQEWPVGTTLATFIESLQQVVLDPASGVFTSRFQDAEQLGIIRECGTLRGPNGHELVLIDYRVITGHWVTAYQADRGLEDLISPSRTNLQWWRELQRSNA